MQLVTAFKDDGWQISFVADAREGASTEALRQLGVICTRLAPNDSAFDAHVAALKPDVTFFDKFTTEEKFGWRVRSAWPASLRVLDTIDLHFLRLGRDKNVAANDIALREVAAIYRSDLSLLTSDHEMRLLQSACNVPASLLHVCRLAYPPLNATKAFHDRQHFAMVGNYKHPPNAEALIWLKKEIWPLIRQKMPNARVDVWGSYAGPEHLSQHAPDDGFYVQGHNEAHWEDLAKRRVNLAPLRAGAGIKGKIADGWWLGTPAVTTAIGAEGMHTGLPFGGLIRDDAAAIADAAVALHEDEALWNTSAADGRHLIESLYLANSTTTPLLNRIGMLRDYLDEARLANFTGAMLWQQGLRATEYFSRWIELKEQRLP